MGSEQSSENRKPPAATNRDVERALEKQRKMYEQNMKELLQEAKKTQSPGSTPTTGPYNGLQPTTSTGFQPHPVPSLNIDQQHNAYNYNQNGPMKPAPLYPTLNTPLQGNAAPMHSMPFNYGGSVQNNNHVYNGLPPQRFSSPQPSAPPTDCGPSRARSQSRQRGPDDDIKCVTCGKNYGEVIYQCNQGHSSCNLCKMRQVPCGQCRQQLTTRRNYDLEKYVMERRVQCPNSSDGCRLYIKMADMALHEKECPFKVLQCPSLGSSCTWSGKLSHLADHFDEMHPLHNQGEVDKEMFMSNIINTSHSMHYIRIGNFNFLFHIKISEPDRKIYMMVQLIGTKHSAAKWDYEIHIYKKNEPRRKFQYIDKCLSSNEPVPEIVKNATCAVIPQEYAKSFICGGSIAYKFYIKRVDDKLKDIETSSATSEKGNASRPRRNNFKKYVKKNKVVN